MAYGLLNVAANDLDCMLQCDQGGGGRDHSGANHHGRPSESLFYSSFTKSARSSRPRRGRLPEHAVQRRASCDEIDPQPTAVSYGRAAEPDRNRESRDTGRPFSVSGVLSALFRLPASGDGDGDGGGNGGGQDGMPSVMFRDQQPEVGPAMTTEIESDYVYGQPHSISVLERLILTHPVWFLRGIYRTGAVHLLQGKEVGNFIIRQSSQPNTMAITVRLPDDKGPYIEHYLIEAVGNNKLRLEGSDFHFSAIPLLVAHYCQCCDELPVQLSLPKSIMTALTKQELTSMAHLGQEFWVSSLAMSPTKPWSPKKPLMPLPLNATIPTARPQMITFGSPSSPTSVSDRNNPPLFSSSTSSLSSLTGSDGKVRSRVAPDPPPRWYSISPPAKSSASENTNFTVTTTVTFHVNQCTASLPVQVEEDMDKDASVPHPTLTTTTMASLTRRQRRHSQPVPLPTVPPLLDSPPGYHCSSVTDKASDYEDIWIQSPTTAVAAIAPAAAADDDRLKETDSSAEGLQVVRALKALGLGTWSYSGSEQNQTDQEKVLARNSQNQIESPGTPFVIEVQSPFYSEPTDSLGGADDGTDSDPIVLRAVADDEPTAVSPPSVSTLKYKRFGSRNISTSLTDLHSGDGLVGGDAGVINTAFRSSSSQLLINGVTPTGDSDGRKGSETAHAVSTLPRAAVKTPKRPTLLQQFADFPFDMYINSAATTLTRRQNVDARPDCNETSWKLDSSWEWYSREGADTTSSNDTDSSSSSNDDDDDEEEVHLRSSRSKKSAFPVLRRPLGAYLGKDDAGSTVTVEELLTQKQPELKVPEIKPLTARNLLRVSEYDNLDECDAEETVASSATVDLIPCKRRAVTVKLPTFVQKQPDLFDDVELRANVNRAQLSSRPPPPPPPPPPSHHHLSIQRKVPSETGSSATEFSEPWDSSRWEQLLMEAAAMGTKQTDAASIVVSDEPPMTSNDKDVDDVLPTCVHGLSEEEELLAALNGSEANSRSTSTLIDGSLDDLDNDQRTDGTVERNNIRALPCLLSLRRKDRHLGRPIRDYVLKMARDNTLMFGQHIENFIQCTHESHETDPHVTMRNMRQFMSGMANFLVNSGEGQFSRLVQEERAKLKSNEFLNLDTILEGVLHRIVVRPLKRHLCQLFVRQYMASGAAVALSDAIKYSRACCADQLRIKPDLRPLQGADMEAVKHYLVRLQRAYSPLKKLENLLTAISIIYQSILHDRGGSQQSMGADDFLPMLTYVLVHCGLIAAEIESEYMWGLLHPSLLSGEGGYYLTTLSSAVHVLKHVQRCHTSSTAGRTGTHETVEGVPLCLSELDGFMKVFVPDEQNGNIISKTVPVRPNMTTKDICKMVAHRLSVSNPQDYALYKLVNGDENILSDTACPWLVRIELITAGVDCVFAYKRTDAKIAWPVHFKKS